MIINKRDYYQYLEEDKRALGIERNNVKIFGDEIWKFQILLRKVEYYSNIEKNIIKKILYTFYKYRFHNLSIKLGFSIPINIFEGGLSIAHYGTIVVHKNAKIGKNCRIHENVTIGATNGTSDAPEIGDNVFIGSGAKILGNIKIASNIAIGANAVVNKSFDESGITIAGVPAKKISCNDSKKYLNKKIIWGEKN